MDADTNGGHVPVKKAFHPVIVTVVMICLVTVVVSNIVLCFVVLRQKTFLDQASQQIQEQKTALTRFGDDVARLSEDLREKGQAVVQIREGLSRTRTEIRDIEKDAVEWKKEYVSALIRVEAKGEAFENELKGFRSEFMGQILPGIREQMRSIKEGIEQIRSGLSRVRDDQTLETPVSVWKSQ